ncbi:MAG TPA: hypothetical protein VHB47_06010 [Thermoanaerobaculia bacterium]|nr:hypothetical protein [Thermoanaerobaculia bacterium]
MSNTPALLTLSGTLFAALLGVLGKYLYDLRIARRKDRLDRINAQLKFLYGPLYATDLAGREAWLAFQHKLRPDDDPHSGMRRQPLTEAGQAERRLWVTQVFMPLNERMEKTIVENADLLPGDEIPHALLAMCAHTAAYKAIRQKWELGDYSDDHSAIGYPWEALREHVQATFKELKKEQAKLLARH